MVLADADEECLSKIKQLKMISNFICLIWGIWKEKSIQYPTDCVKREIAKEDLCNMLN